MGKKILGLGTDGKLVLRLPGGRFEPLPEVMSACAFILIDCSKSMRGVKIAQARDGAIAFAENARGKGYSVGLIGFATSAETLCLPEENFSTLVSRAERLEAKGTTNVAEAITVAARELSARPGTRAIVIATDGMPDDQAAALDAARKAKDAGIDVITIGTDDADRDFLRKVASRSDLVVNVARNELREGIAGVARLLPSTGDSR
jgi:Mg-chelatase subunit ChlD